MKMNLIYFEMFINLKHSEIKWANRNPLSTAGAEFLKITAVGKAEPLWKIGCQVNLGYF
jgi:hypothetical protein